MCRNLGIALFVIALAVLFPSAAAQQSGSGASSLAIGARITYANVEDALEDSMGGGTSVDDEFGYGAMVKFPISQRLWLQFAADAFTFTGDLSELDFSISADLETIPLTGTLLLDLVSRNNTIRPYLGAGIGYYLNDFDDITESAFGFIIDLKEYADFDADDGFGWHVCAGLDWFVTDHLAINLEALYRWVEYDWDIIMRPFGLRELGGDLSDSGSDNLDGWAVILGLSLFF
ncbi:outer membrane beta-barrel protein [bacterium]|nr:outer membrane beta-barrel protein [bacterium]